MHAEFPIGAFIASALVLVPLPWHWRARSIATCSMIFWLFVDNLTLAINSIIWADSVKVVVPIWCEIVTRLQLASNIALPAACFCLCVRLESIASARHANIPHALRRRWAIFDIIVCWGLPALYVVLHYVVQGHRFDIVERLGCRPTFYVSIASLFIIMLPPLVLSVATLIFAGIALCHFFRRRLDFARHLARSNSALTTARYFRLMLMSIVLMTWTTIISSLNTWFSCRGGLRPWISWENVHVGFGQIGQFPVVFLSQYDWSWTVALWWTIPISAYTFAAFFMFGEDAMKEYAACWAWIRVHGLRRPKIQPKPSGYLHTLDSMPSARSPRKRDTFASTFTIDRKPGTAANVISKPILSQAALRSFATEDTHEVSEPYTPMPSTPSDCCPPGYDSDEDGDRRLSKKSNTMHPHDMT